MLRVILFAIISGLALPAAAQRPKGALECKATGTDFVYNCVIRLTQGGKPLKNVKLTVGADMPSMPMAHNVRPVIAKPAAQPGVYHATLELEMLGLWTVKLRLAGPVRDQLVLHYEFDNQGAKPAMAGASPTMPHGSGMKRGSGMPQGAAMPHGSGMQQGSGTSHGSGMQSGAPMQQGK